MAHSGRSGRAANAAARASLTARVSAPPAESARFLEGAERSRKSQRELAHGGEGGIRTLDGVSDGDSTSLIYNHPDSDGDGPIDGDEVNLYGTSSVNTDSERDDISDFDEIFGAGVPAVSVGGALLLAALLASLVVRACSSEKSRRQSGPRPLRCASD